MGPWLLTNALLLLLALATSADEPTLHFTRHGEEVSRVGIAELSQLTQPRTLRVFEPYEAREISFRAWPLAEILDRVYGPGWRSEDEILFTCADGYQPSVPVSRLLEHGVYLAFARSDLADFTIQKRESGRLQTVSLAPYYVIWDNLDSAPLRRDGDYGWPYQVVGIELIRATERFPAMAPPAQAATAAQLGFKAFRIHCSRCHPVNGVGGRIGPELQDRPDPVGERDPAWLRRWIDDPSSFAATARMPALNPALPDRARTLNQLVAYLQALAETPRTP